MKFKFFYSIFLFSVMLFTSCDKAYVPDEADGGGGKTNNNVIINISKIEQVHFDDYNATSGSRSESVDISKLCTRIGVSMFSGEDKVKSISQTSSDENFGQIAMSLAEGTYSIVVIAHNCEGSATISTPSKITFPSNVVSDTFYYYGEITVGSSASEYNLELKRAVAMVRFVVNDAIPADVSTMKFYYIGGSSTFDAVSGYGCVDSRQTVKIAKGSSNQFELYTFPHEETGTLKMTVSALDASENVLTENVFEDMSVQRNMITKYSGDFFGQGGSSSDNNFTLKANSEWSGEKSYSY